MTHQTNRKSRIWSRINGSGRINLATKSRRCWWRDVSGMIRKELVRDFLCKGSSQHWRVRWVAVRTAVSKRWWWMCGLDGKTWKEECAGRKMSEEDKISETWREKLMKEWGMCEQEGYAKRETGKLNPRLLPPVKVCLKLIIRMQKRSSGLPYNCSMVGRSHWFPKFEKDFFNYHANVHSIHQQATCEH